MQLVHINLHIKKFKIIYLTHIISILNSVFNIVLCMTEINKIVSHLHMF
jgi:hypothetical protein